MGIEEKPGKMLKSKGLKLMKYLVYWMRLINGYGY